MSKFIDVLAASIVYIHLFKKWECKDKYKIIINTAMYIYIVMVLYVTLMPIIVSIPNVILGQHYITINLIPFDDYFNGRGDTVRQILLNIIMMIPFGFLLPMVKNKKFIICVIWTFLFSLAIEILQPLFERSADITDVINNTIGGILGYLLYLIVKLIVNKFFYKGINNIRKLI